MGKKEWIQGLKGFGRCSTVDRSPVPADKSIDTQDSRVTKELIW
jgi:hypothetical protein